MHATPAKAFSTVRERCTNDALRGFCCQNRGIQSAVSTVPSALPRVLNSVRSVALGDLHPRWLLSREHHMAVGGARDRGSALEWGLSRMANCFRDPQEVPERLCLRREGRARSPLILFGYQSLLFYICLKSRLLLGFTCAILGLCMTSFARGSGRCLTGCAELRKCGIKERYLRFTAQSWPCAARCHQGGHSTASEPSRGG